MIALQLPPTPLGAETPHDLLKHVIAFTCAALIGVAFTKIFRAIERYYDHREKDTDE